MCRSPTPRHPPGTDAPLPGRAARRTMDSCAGTRSRLARPREAAGPLRRRDPDSETGRSPSRRTPSSALRRRSDRSSPRRSSSIFASRSRCNSSSLLSGGLGGGSATRGSPDLRRCRCTSGHWDLDCRPRISCTRREPFIKSHAATVATTAGPMKLAVARVEIALERRVTGARRNSRATPSRRACSLSGPPWPASSTARITRGGRRRSGHLRPRRGRPARAPWDQTASDRCRARIASRARGR